MNQGENIIKELNEIEYCCRLLSKQLRDKELSNEWFNKALTIRKAINFITNQIEVEKKQEEVIKDLRKANHKLLEGDYYTKLQEHQNQLISNIIGYLEDLRY